MHLSGLRHTATPKRRRLLCATAVLSTAAVMMSGAGAPVASADPLLPLPSLCGFSAPGNDSGVEVDAIKQLKAAYFQSIDAKNWAALRDLLAPGVVEDTTCSAGPLLVGRDPFISFLKVSLGAATTQHQGYDAQVKVTSATTAEALWTMEDVLIFGGVLGVHGYGHYNDKYQKVDGKWVVTYSKLTRTRMDLINPDGTVTQEDAPLAEVAAKVKAITGQ